MKHENPIENINVTTVSATAAAATATDVKVDADRLALALADHAAIVSEKKAHRLELENLQNQIKELNVEIISIQSLLKDFDLANNSIAIEDIKDFANRKYRAKLEVETLSEIRDELKKKYPVMERDYSRLDSITEIESKRYCWKVLYEGLLQSIDIESLKQLIVVGIAAGKHESNVIDDLKLGSIEYQRLEALAKQFNLPA